MSTSTTNLHLTKPAASEHADIAIINANYDLIDDFAGTVVVDPDYVHTENNYTTTEKQKLEGLENYTLPTASSSTKGGVKVDNESISIDQSGTISAALSGLNEVNIDAVTLSDGQILKFDATSGKWINASGGSGHTILDDDGTALAQEDDLQFKGVYSTDNSEDGVTEVNVYREMTKAEFNALSSDEKKGFIRVTDEPDIYSDGHFQPVIYSIEEREIGVWTDGKPLYQKSYIGLNVEIINASTWYDTGLSASGVDRFVAGEMIDINNQSYPVNVAFMSSNTKIGISCGMANRTGVILTIRYTKTSDIPGSGSWTPQGVPAVHYSTDEQVIGTWNGETLYGRMFEVSHTFTQGDNDIELQSNVDFVSSDIKTYDASTVLSNGAVSKRVSVLPDDTLYVNSSNKLILYFNCTNPSSIGTRTVRVVAQYTKSS